MNSFNPLNMYYYPHFTDEVTETQELSNAIFW